jgi:SIR2-like protein/uncharacterized protein DUF4020
MRTRRWPDGHQGPPPKFNGTRDILAGPLMVSWRMRIRAVDMPRALIEAHREGSLVIFVGAGASRDAPSGLPDFRRLAADIAADAGVEVTDDQLEQPDILLGDLKDRHSVDVHRRVADRLAVQSSQPNRLHKAIAALAAAGPRIRMVTTNYDLHLSTALDIQGSSAFEYMAPALPLGDDFAGLVYLHGCLRQEPGALVITDSDFGRAYLRDAWAARFLERMFATYTVLFIGYSHNDVVMSYLARALRADSARFVLTHQPDAPHWRRLSVQPVGYPIISGAHSALSDATGGWASWAAMGLLDHRQRVEELLSAAPTRVPEETSYLEEVIAHPETVGFFTEYARGPDWLTWAAGQPGFQRLFVPSVETSDCTRALSYWFAHDYAMAADLTGLALSLAGDTGGRLGPDLWAAVASHPSWRQSARPEWLGPWLVLLLQNVPEFNAGQLDLALAASRWPEDRASALLLFDFLTEPQALQRPSIALNGNPRFDIRLRGQGYWLSEAWKGVFVPHLAEAAADALVIVDRHLRRAHLLLTTAGTARPGWDPLSFDRSAIEPHPQDDMRQPFDVLIDAARDCIEALLDRGGDEGDAYLRMWADTDVPLLRRLAVHGWTHRNDMDASAKLAWLGDRGWLYDLQLRHEVFRLIQATVADAEVEVADALVADVLAGSPRHRDYEIFNALSWIVRHTPGLQSAREALDQVKSQHPDYQERPYPDLGVSLEIGWVRPKPPMTAQALHDHIRAEPSAAITELLQYKSATSIFDGPTWDDATDLLVEVARAWPEDGFAILDAQGGGHPDVVNAVIRGWAASAVDDETAESIVERLTHVDLATARDEITRLLAHGGQGQAAPTEWHRLQAARRLAASVWTAIPVRPAAGDAKEWLGRAINHPAGQLAQFWVKAIEADWRAAGDTWPGLSETTRQQLEAMLAGQDDRVAMSEVIFASQLYFFHSTDRTWCLDNVLPLLDWQNPVRARRTWDGFLTWGRWNDQLLSASLLSQYLETAKHVAEFREELRRQLCLHLATIALHSELNSPADGWIKTFTATVSVNVRTDWMNQVCWRLRELPAEAIEHQWQRWMRRYWAGRLASIPSQLSDQEASAMAAWVIYLTDSVEDGVTLATEHSASLADHSQVLQDLTEERIIRAPDSIARLLTHLLQGTQQPFYECHSLHQIAEILRRQPTHVDVSGITEQAFRLGCGDILKLIHKVGKAAARAAAR